MNGCEIVFHAAALPYEGLSMFSKLCVESIVSGTVSMASAAIATGLEDLLTAHLWHDMVEDNLLLWRHINKPCRPIWAG